MASPANPGASEVIIAIMGATGSGKTTFINLIGGSNLEVGRGLRSCTSAVQFGGTFDLDDRRVALIDTPGFDDTTLSDTDILNTIATFLEASYKNGATLAGVLYFHRISDPRMGGMSTKNFRMFRKLCGDNTLKNVIIVTNMWGQVDPEIGNAREKELMRDELFFKHALEKGANIARHENTISSAQAIVRRVFDNHPLPLRIQVELGDQGMNISETGAGEELQKEYAALIKKHEREMRKLRNEMEEAMRKKDEETRMELGMEIERLQRETDKLGNDARRMESDYKLVKERLESRLSQGTPMFGISYTLFGKTFRFGIGGD